MRIPINLPGQFTFRPPKPCARCGKIFKGPRPNNRYCSRYWPNVSRQIWARIPSGSWIVTEV